MNRRTLILADGANLAASTASLNLRVDFAKVLKVFGEDLFRAYYFTALPDRTVDAPIFKLVDYLKHNGWDVVSKTVKEYHDEATGKIKFKGNMDVELTVHALRYMGDVRHVVLFSGDGDFAPLVEELKHDGLLVTVVSSYGCDNPMIADILRASADRFVDLARRDVQESIRKAAEQTERPKAAFVQKFRGFRG